MKKKGLAEVSPLQIEPDGTVDAYLNTWLFKGGPDLQGDRVRYNGPKDNAWYDFVVAFNAASKPLPIFYQHIYDSPQMLIGEIRPGNLSTDGKGLKARMHIFSDEENPTAGWVLTLIRKGLLDSCSVGYEVIKEHRLKDGSNQLDSLWLNEG